jgi:uncharacterized protein YdhG (YjbR/CyaY superfamily)
MEKSKPIPATVDEYMADFPTDVKKRMQQLRKTIKAAAPKADEVISYQMPGISTGMLVYFAAYKNHIGFYPEQEGYWSSIKNCLRLRVPKDLYNFPMTGLYLLRQ